MHSPPNTRINLKSEKMLLWDSSSSCRDTLVLHCDPPLICIQVVMRMWPQVSQNVAWAMASKCTLSLVTPVLAAAHLWSDHARHLQVCCFLFCLRPALHWQATMSATSQSAWQLLSQALHLIMCEEATKPKWEVKSKAFLYLFDTPRLTRSVCTHVWNSVKEASMCDLVKLLFTNVNSFVKK